MHLFSQQIQAGLQVRANAKKADWWNNYMKGIIPFYGVGIPDIRKLVKEVAGADPMEVYSWEEQISFLSELMAMEHTEEKLAAVLFMQLYWKKAVDPVQQLGPVSDWFDREWIFDWNTCDWLCVRVLTPLVDSRNEGVYYELREWNRSDYLWKARASLVAFAQCESLREHKGLVEEFSKRLIKREERFAKTAVGWVMREFSRFDPDFVKGFLEAHARYVTREVERNALKYL